MSKFCELCGDIATVEVPTGWICTKCASNSIHGFLSHVLKLRLQLMQIKLERDVLIKRISDEEVYKEMVRYN